MKSTVCSLQSTETQTSVVGSRWTVDQKKGFTLVELMVAISIIAILTVIGITVYTGQEKAARLTKVRQDFEAISKQIQIARQAQNKTMCDITGDAPSCNSDVDCRYPPKQMAHPNCLTKQQLSWSRVTGKPYDQQPLPTDPWGSMYTFDENEMEQNYTYGGSHVYCRWDMLHSAGRDGILWNGDDYYYFVPPFQCKTFEFPEAIGILGTRLY